eukprot:12438787-Alexandrium_andersonii.AAC.1
MVLTIMMVMARSANMVQNRSPELPRGHFAPMFALSANTATRTAPELIWGSFLTAFRAESGAS